MKLKLFTLILAAATFSASAVTISQWTFENPPADLFNSSSSPNVSATTGTGTASGLHASTGTDWSTPVGNGSANAFSANEWAVGDYWQFRLSTVGFSDIAVGYDQTSSATGPITFDFAYSLNGSSFFNFASAYTVLVNSAGNGGVWNSTTSIPNYHFGWNLSAITTLNNAADVYFRVRAAAAPGGLAGTDRLDDFTVSGNVFTAVPDSSLGWVGWSCLLAVVALSRWRLIPARR